MPVIYEPRGRAKEYSLLACNLYKGCLNRCTYCYAPTVARSTRQAFHTNVTARKNVIEELRRDVAKHAGTRSRLLLCFLCDPYPPPMTEKGITRQALQVLVEHDIPFQVLTKAGPLAARDFDLYGPNDAFATTLTYAQDDGRTLEHEPHAALPSARMHAIRLAKVKDIETWVSLEPVLDPDESLECIRLTHEYVDLYKIGKLNHEKSSTDWRKFGIQAVTLCEKYGVPYYVKDDLANYLDGVDFTNTDTRMISE